MCSANLAQEGIAVGAILALEPSETEHFEHATKAGRGLHGALSSAATTLGHDSPLTIFPIVAGLTPNHVESW